MGFVYDLHCPGCGFRQENVEFGLTAGCGSELSLAQDQLTGELRHIETGFREIKDQRRSKPTMEKSTLAVFVTVAFSVIGVLGDYFLKLASSRDQPLRTGWFYLGFALYASTAFGWVFVMRHLKLATISVVYSISMVLLLTAVGVTAFEESLNYYELAGIIMAVASLVLLMRFA